MANYAEDLFQSIGLIAEQKLKSLQFDKTIEATIIDATKASQGIYTVSNEGSSFVAYSAETGYQENDVVMVNIPQGDYSKQKNIIGRCIDDKTASPLVYKSPFSQIANLSGNLITVKNLLSRQDLVNMEEISSLETEYENIKNEYINERLNIPSRETLISNKETLLENQEVIKTSFNNNEIEEDQYEAQMNALQEQIDTIDNQLNRLEFLNQQLGTTGDDGLLKEEYDEKKRSALVYKMFANDIYKSSFLLWDSEEIENSSKSDFFSLPCTKIGIKADFSTWLKDYNTTSGDYGLLTIITFKDKELPIENQIFSVVFTFNCNEFLGNVYDFNLYTTQEAVFDISEYAECEIERIQLYAYQENNFKNSYNELIYDITDFVSFENLPVASEDQELTEEDLNDIIINYSIKSNILIRNPYVCLGVSSEDFTGDTALIYNTSNSNLYYKTQKENQNRKLDNKKILNLRWVHRDETSNLISLIPESQILENYEIRWYRYKLGSVSADQFSGVHWERFYGCKENPDEKEDYGITLDDLNNNLQDIATNRMNNIVFYPNINKETEQFKVIIVKKEVLYNGQGETVEYKIAESPIYVFSNEEEVRNEANFIDTNALSIRYEDDQKGNYFVYNKARQLFSKEQNIVRKLTAVFDTTTDNILDKSKLTTPYTYIKWIFPASQTMIQPIKFDTLNSPNPEVLNKSMFPTINDYENGIAINHISINDDSYIYYNQNNDTYEFFVSINPYEENENIQKETLISVGYYINQQLNYNYSNNLVQLEVLRDGQVYNASIQMRFGTSGTSGSDYTLVVDWEDNAFDIEKGKLSGQVRLFNQSDEIDLNSIDSTCEYSWYRVRQSAIEQDSNKSNKSIAENRDVYYPIINNAFKTVRFYDKVWDEENEQYIDIKITDNNDYYLNYGVLPLSTEGEGRIDYLNENAPLAYYDLKDKKFKPKSWNEYSNDKLFYRKLSPNEDKKPEMNFQPIKTIKSTSPIDNITGAIHYNEQNGLIERIFGHDDYSKKYKLFIKYNDSYIIDPWDSYKENETYYEPIYSENKIYQTNNDRLLAIESNSNKKGYFTITDQRTEENPITNRTPDIENDLYILQVKLNNFGDYPLIARFPIALKNSAGMISRNGNPFYYIDYIEGANTVRYSSSGEKDFDKSIYNIYCHYLNKTGNPEDNDYSENFFNISNEKDFSFGHWELVYDNNLKQDQDYLLPRLIEMSSEDKSNLENKDNIYYYPSLEPSSIYVDSSFIYGIKFVTDNDVESDYNYPSYKGGQPVNSYTMIPAGTTLWMQPIYTYQDNYPSTTLNQWGGKGVTINEDNGTIVANGFSAGRKEVDNTFSGVVLGDWSKTDSDLAITKQTGIYGFHHGAISYALKEDGTAFFGKDGKGRIYFNGNTAKIYSTRWLSVSGGDSSSYIYSQNPEGMMLDLDDGILDTRKGNVRTLIEPGKMQIYKANKLLLNIQSRDNNNEEGTFLLQSANYDNDNSIGTKFNLNDGEIQAFNFKLTAGTGDNKIIITSDNSQNSKPLKIGNNFSINWDGSLIAGTNNSVQINADGSFSFGNGTKITYDSTNGLVINGAITATSLTLSNTGFSVGSTPSNNTTGFNLSSAGLLTASNATIYGTVYASAGVFSGALIIGQKGVEPTQNNLTPSVSNSGLYIDTSGNLTAGPDNPIQINADGTFCFGTNENKIEWNNNILDVIGTINANAGNIGAWTIDNNSLRGRKNTSTYYCDLSFVIKDHNSNKFLDRYGQFCYSKLTDPNKRHFHYDIYEIKHVSLSLNKYHFFGTKEFLNKSFRYQKANDFDHCFTVYYFDTNLLFNTTIARSNFENSEDNIDLLPPTITNETYEEDNGLIYYDLAHIREVVENPDITPRKRKRPVLIERDQNEEIIATYWLSSDYEGVNGDISLGGGSTLPFGGFKKISITNLNKSIPEMNLTDFLEYFEKHLKYFPDTEILINNIDENNYEYNYVYSAVAADKKGPYLKTGNVKDYNLLLKYDQEEIINPGYTFLNPMSSINANDPVLSIGTPISNTIPQYDKSKICLFNSGKITSFSLQVNDQIITPLITGADNLEINSNYININSNNIKLFFPEDQDNGVSGHKFFDDQYHTIIEICDKDTNWDSGLYFGTPPNDEDSNNNKHTQNTFIRGRNIYLYTLEQQYDPSSHAEMTQNGAVYLQRSGGVAVTSDENFKDINNINQKYEKFFDNLNPILYNYKNRNRIHLGFGARAVEQALKDADLTTTDFAGILKDEFDTNNQLIDDGFLYSLRYEEFIALNTYMIKKAFNKIKELKAEIKTLKES